MIVSSRVLACLALVALQTAIGPAATHAAAAPAPGVPTSGATPVVMAARPGTPLDRAARALIAQDLTEAAQSGDQPLLLIGSARLGAASDRPALFIQLQSPRECGSAGCSTSAYIWLKGKSGEGRWAKVLDGVNGEVAVATAQHRGMADLVVNAERYAWTGKNYANSQPAPVVDLRPRTPPSRAVPQRIPLPSIPPTTPPPGTPAPGAIVD